MKWPTLFFLGLCSSVFLLASCGGSSFVYRNKPLPPSSLAKLLNNRRAGIVAGIPSTRPEGVKYGQARGGSAAPIHPDGYLLTAAHVVSGVGSPDLLVLFPPGAKGKKNEVPGRLVWVDQASDLALIKVDIPTPQFYAFTDPQALIPPGLSVVHAGLTTGHYGRVGEVTEPVLGHKSLGTAQGFTHSLPLDSGDSGGPLVATSGELVGINSAVSYLKAFNAPFFTGSRAIRPDPAKIARLIAIDQRKHPARPPNQ